MGSSGSREADAADSVVYMRGWVERKSSSVLRTSWNRVFAEVGSRGLNLYADAKKGTSKHEVLPKNFGSVSCSSGKKGRQVSVGDVVFVPADESDVPRWLLALRAAAGTLDQAVSDSRRDGAGTELRDIAVRNLDGGAAAVCSVPADGNAHFLFSLLAQSAAVGAASVRVVASGEEVQPCDAVASALPHGAIAYYLVVGAGAPAAAAVSDAFKWEPLYAGEVVYSAGGKCATKQSHRPDVNNVIADRTFTSGVLDFTIRVNSKNDEMWIGVTDDKSTLQRIRGGRIRRHRSIYAYCDGSRGRSLPCAGSDAGSPDPYSSGDLISVKVTFATRTIEFRRNGVVVGSYTSLPDRRRLWPFVALDAPRDRVTIESATHTP